MRGAETFWVQCDSRISTFLTELLLHVLPQFSLRSSRSRSPTCWERAESPALTKLQCWWLSGLCLPGCSCRNAIKQQSEFWKPSQRDSDTAHLFPARAIILHAVLGSHGLGAVQGGGIKRHLLNLGNMTRNVSLAQSFCLVPVPPVLEELLKQRCLTTLRENLDLKQMSQLNRSSRIPIPRGSSSGCSLLQESPDCIRTELPGTTEITAAQRSVPGCGQYWEQQQVSPTPQSETQRSVAPPGITTRGRSFPGEKTQDKLSVCCLWLLVWSALLLSSQCYTIFKPLCNYT